MWILDLLYMLSEKYSPKEIINDSKFKKDLHDMINEKLFFSTGWVANSFIVKFNEPSAQTQQSLNNAIDKRMKEMIVQSLQQYKILSPYSPTVYEISLSFYSQIHILEHAPKNIANKMKELQISQLDQFIFDNIDTLEEAAVHDKFKLFVLETLKTLSLELLQNSYSPERQDRVVVRVKDFIEPLYTVIENKSNANFQLIESSSELICNLLEKAPLLLIKDFKKNILETFNKDNFFSCNKITLRYWGKIIDWVITHDKSSDLFTEYLEKVGLSAGFFAREQTENKRKIKSFKRICFIIFSGSKDKYVNRLKTLLDHIADVIKSADNTHQSLLILILFCIRILILRLSQSNLNDLFRQIWPILLTLLIQIYSKPSAGQPPRNSNLMLAGLKLIEILSVAQLDEFYLHQWMFIFDYFGLKLQPFTQQEIENQSKLRGQMNEVQLKQFTKISPFYFQPFVSTCLNEQDLYIKYINVSIDEEDSYETVTYQKKYRKIVMTQCKVDDESELRIHALSLCQYLISNNENRTEIDFKQIEALIEDDFINLDENILKV